MTHKTKRQNNGHTEMDTTMMSMHQRESAYLRLCPSCKRRGAMVKVINDVYHYRYCKYCNYTEIL